MKKSKYTIEVLEPLVKSSFSTSEVMRKLNLKFSGGTFQLILNRIKDLNIDSSHFINGPKASSKINKLTYQEILVNRRLNNRRESSANLRWALKESGVEEKCEQCEILPEYNGKFLRLQIDHINGDCLDNSNGNCRFLCPNCHSQTENFGSKNMTNTKENNYIITPVTINTPSSIKKASACIICGIMKTNKNKTCSFDCSRKSISNSLKKNLRSKIWDNINLEQEIKTKSIVQIADELGCSDSAIHKRLKKLNLK